MLLIYLLPGANQIESAKGVYAAMEQLKTYFPEDVAYAVSYDTTPAVQASITGIVHTLLEAIVLVVLVVFVFLQNFRATLIPLLTVPVSLLGTFALFPLLGFSVNTLSLFGMVLAMGSWLKIPLSWWKPSCITSRRAFRPGMRRCRR